MLEAAGPNPRTRLFSATMPEPIRRVAETYMGEYEMVVDEKEEDSAELTDQIYFEVHEQDKFEALCRIIDMEENFYGLVFCRTKIGVDELVHRLTERSYAAEGLHGDIGQAQRELILGRFRKKRTAVLVATDVAARGIDIANLSHVINFSLPQDTESYIHRIGRTGRAGSEGTAVTFVTPSEFRKLAFLKRAAKAEIRKEKVPRVDDVIEAKRRRLLSAIRGRAGDPGLETFRGMAAELLADGSPEAALAAALCYAFQGHLDRTKYREIREIRDYSVDRTGKSRLLIHLGKKDGATKRFLTELIERETGVSARDLRDVEGLDSRSFVTVPFREAEKILRIFRRKSKGAPFLVEIRGKKPAGPPAKTRRR